MIEKLKLVSYNILANAYIKPKWFSKVETEMLDGSLRKEWLFKKIIGFNADVICLQEVEADVFEELNALLAAQAYAGKYAQKLGKPDGCATFVKNELPVSACEVIHYNQDAANRSGHLALITTLLSGSDPIKIINTHIKWDQYNKSEHEHMGFSEVVQLLDYVNLNQGAGFIICGDFNIEANSHVIQEILAREFTDACAANPQFTSNSNQRAKRIDYIFVNKHFRASVERIADLVDQTILPTRQEPSDHLALIADIVLNEKSG